jgi:hypothetical protein
MEMMTERMEDARNLYAGGPESEVEEKIDWLDKKRLWGRRDCR